MQSLNYSISKIAQILKYTEDLVNPLAEIKHLVIDSRNVVLPENCLFFALSSHRDGHDFIADAYQKNIRNFVVSQSVFINQYPDCNFILVNNVLKSLQALAQYHKEQFTLKTIGITGSNGKTIVKEWLYQLMHNDFNIVRSPKSFNSQIGVPLSVWQITADNNLAIFEAGISSENEMDALEEIIKPDIGILTNIAEAHAEGFTSIHEKLEEKLKLFKSSSLIIYSPDYVEDKYLSNYKGNTFTWSFIQKADLEILKCEIIGEKCHIRAEYHQKEINCTLPFKDKASIENGIICWATLLALDYKVAEIAVRLANLTRVSMRLELKNGINQCSIIDDSYSNDISSLAIALDFLNQQNQQEKKTVILSDLVESGKTAEELYTLIAKLLQQKKINRLIGIGADISSYADKFKIEAQFFNSTEEFLKEYAKLSFNREIILVKGARRYGFERISKLLALKIHDTILEVDLNAMVSNLQFYRSKLKPNVKIMAMVKAFSYGSGSFEIANLLQFHKIDYLTVAYADEGIALRKAGITLPIMVMSPEEHAFEAIRKYKLEPEIYSLEVINKFLSAITTEDENYPIHLKIDTGMHRLGFDELEIKQLINLTANKKIEVKSIFSHLVASDSTQHDDFTKKQIEIFKRVSSQIIKVLNYKPLLHISNTSGIIRWPDANFDMVRLGIGLYGFDAAILSGKNLQTVMTLKTTVSQVKVLPAGETVGYSRKGVLPKGGKVATVKIGYADGYSRAFGNGIGKMLVNGNLAPTIGSICMDMTMLDVTGIEVNAGDEVIVFNGDQTIEELASSINTIPYEILTNISQRVKRVYLYD